MLDAGSPSEAPLARMRGKAEIAFRRDGDSTRLAHLFQQAPLRVLFPDPPLGEPPQAALVTTSGGLAGGDHISLSVSAGEGASALAVASAAEKIYRSTGPDTLVEVALTAESGSWLEFLPQETIVFDGARLRRSTRVDLRGDARLLAGEMLVFGRAAKGEALTHGLVRDSWSIRRDGRLIWTDALHMEGDLAATLAAPAGFDGAIACATLVLAAPDPIGARDLAREALAGYEGRAGATLVAGLMIARWLDADPARLRHSFGSVWAALRHRAAGLPPQLPRLWEI